MTFVLHPIDDLPKEIKVNTHVDIGLIIGDVECMSAWIKARA